MEFVVKQIIVGEQKTYIVLQNENGPCPLLAISNCLLLRDSIALPANNRNSRTITLEEIIGILANLALTKTDVASSFSLNEILTLMPSLARGLDVNVKFHAGVSGFEFTDQITAFDFFGVSLVHGWLNDPQDEMTANAIGGRSYNQLIEQQCLESDLRLELEGKEKEKEKEKEGEEGKEKLCTLAEELNTIHLVKTFLNSTRSQLTYYGLQELHGKLPTLSYSVLFRNNHFSTCFFNGESLFLLCTDEGYLTGNIVWEKLGDIDGDSEYVDGFFVAARVDGGGVNPFSEHDEDLAKAITESYADNVQGSGGGKDEHMAVGTMVAMPEEGGTGTGAEHQLRSDETFVRNLVEQEQRAQQQQQQRVQQQQQQQQRVQQQQQREQQKSNCNIC